MPLLVSCGEKDLSEKMENEIIAADKAMSELAQKEGFYKALSTYAAEDFIKLSDGSFPVIGKKNFDDVYKEPGTKAISWTPVKAEVAKSGELGYTFGNWQFKQNDTNSVYGNYFTVWRKYTDGKWKIVLDGGNSTPDPNGNM